MLTAKAGEIRTSGTLLFEHPRGGATKQRSTGKALNRSWLTT
jgi:hypothetical protein